MKIYFNKRKMLVSAIIAAAILVVFCCFFSWKRGMVYSFAFLMAGLVNIKFEDTRWHTVLDIIWGICTITATFYISRVMVGLSLTKEMVVAQNQLLNILLVAIVCGILFCLSGRWKFSVILGSFLMLFLVTANNWVFDFRGNELVFTDLHAIQAAANVVNQYHITVSMETTYGWILWGLLILGGFAYPQIKTVVSWKIRLSTLLAAAAMAVYVDRTARNIPLYMWNGEGTYINGCYLNIYISAQKSFVESPENYAGDKIKAMESQYAAEETAEEKQAYPDIVVIMNESFADLRVLGDGLETNQPVMPFLDTMKENTVRGYALTSIFGGVTPNSEFEFLTGFSMANLPDGSIPYQQYMQRDTYSLAWLLRSLGYDCLGTHPYYGSGWNRSRNYPYLGFDQSDFLEAYPQTDYVRGYISDREMYRYVLDTLKEADSPQFIFGVTMQNHGGYTYSGDHYTQTIELTSMADRYPEAEQYLSLIRESDSAFEQLIRELEKADRDTVVLMFGDHLPSLPKSFYSEVHGGSFEGLREKCMQYTVPFYIWANYDIPEQEVALTSLNYLASYLLEAAGIPLTGHHKFLLEMEDAIPAMNMFGFYSAERGEIVEYSAATEQEQQWLSQYAMLQYNALFDNKEKSELLFSRYFTK